MPYLALNYKWAFPVNKWDYWFHFSYLKKLN
jgi:hypothetical protein